MDVSSQMHSYGHFTARGKGLQYKLNRMHVWPQSCPNRSDMSENEPEIVHPVGSSLYQIHYSRSNLLNGLRIILNMSV
jgi:hypothetical protein